MIHCEVVLEDRIRLLRQTAICTLLPDEEVTNLARHGRIVQASSGETIVQQGEVPTKFCILLNGKSHVILKGPHSCDGEIVLHTLGAGAAIGEVALLSGEPRTASVIAAETCRLYELGVEAFQSHVHQYSGFLLALSQVVARRLTNSTRAVSSFAFEDATSRVLSALLSVAEECVNAKEGFLMVRELPSHKDLASRAGTSREVVSRALKALEACGTIERVDRHLLYVRRG